MKCRICEEEMRPPSPESHRLEYSPVDNKICLGCWIGVLDFEKFLVRSTPDRVFWTLQCEAALKDAMERLKRGEYSPYRRSGQALTKPSTD